jgi:hypothetical protein
MLAVLAVLALQQPVLEPGDRRIGTGTASVFEAPTRTSRVVRKAEPGEVLHVLSVENTWAKVRLPADSVGYVKASCFSSAARSAAIEADLEALAAQGLEIGRCDWGWDPMKACLKGFESQLTDLDGLQQRNRTHDRARLEEKLREFRRGGRLGEFAPPP